MNVNFKYHDVKIENNSFSIVKCSKKSKLYNNAFTTLEKIEQILKNPQRFSVSEDSRRELKRIAANIVQGYHFKVVTSKKIFKRFFNRTDQINLIYKRILHLVTPPIGLPIPQVLTNKISEYLGLSDTTLLFQLNRTSTKALAPIMTKRAKELFGFEGENWENIQQYYKELMREQRSFYGYPFPYHLEDKHKFSSLRNLREADINSIVWHFSRFHIDHYPIHRRGCVKVKKLFSLCVQRKAESGIQPDIEYRDFSLRGAIVHNDIELTKLMLKWFKVDFSVSILHPLHDTSYYRGSLEMMKLLISHKADVNELWYGYTPLHYECTRIPPRIEVVKLLLAHGADPASTLDYAKRYHRIADIVPLLEAAKQTDVP